MLRGHLLWQTEGLVEPVPPGSVYFTLPEQTHGSVEEFEPGHEWVYAVITSRPGRGKRPGRLLPAKLGFSAREEREIVATLRATKHHAHPGTELLPVLLRELEREKNGPGGALGEARMAGLAKAAVVELVRCVRAGEARARPSVRAGTATRVRRLVEMLAADPGRPWTLAEMGVFCRLGRTQLTAELREQTGDAPIRLLQRLRVQAARRLLRETDWPVTRIAHECGFGTSQYFAYVFKRESGGLDARAYRKLHRGGEANITPHR